MNSSADKLNSPQLSRETEALYDELFAVAYRMGRLMSSRRPEFQKGSGMSPPQYMILKTLSVEGPMRTSDLASMMGVKNPAVSMMTHGMIKRGWIKRQSDPNDKRAVRLTLTPKGTQCLDDSDDYRRALMRIMAADLSDSDLEHFIRILTTLSETVAREI